MNTSTNSNISKLSPRDVQLGIKDKIGVEGFCEKYDCSLEQLERRIKNLYRFEHEEMMAKIRASGKKSKSKAKSEPKSEPKSETKPKSKKTTKPVAQETIAEATKPEEAEAATASKKQAGETLEERLAYLENHKSVLSDEVMALENQFYNKVVEHKGYLKAMRAIQADLAGIEDAYKAKFAELERVAADDAKTVLEYNQLSDALREKGAALDSVSAEIDALSFSIIGVFEDGRIGIFDGPAATFDDSNFEPLFAQLKDLEECEMLRVCDIRTLARVITIMSRSNNQLGVVFENDDMEAVYKQISGRFL